MKYVKNNMGFSLKFTLGTGTAEHSYSFDCERIYSDTGNVASDGITALDDSTYKKLCDECVQFKKMVERGSLSLVSKPAGSAAQEKAKELESENAKLKKQLAEATSALTESTGGKASAKEKKLADENKTLKEQLEALKKESAELKASIEKKGEEGF